MRTKQRIVRADKKLADATLETLHRLSREMHRAQYLYPLQRATLQRIDDEIDRRENKQFSNETRYERYGKKAR